MTASFNACLALHNVQNSNWKMSFSNIHSIRRERHAYIQTLRYICTQFAIIIPFPLKEQQNPTSGICSSLYRGD